jgi:hypothetical protein
MKHVPLKRTKILYFVFYYNHQEQYGRNVNFLDETDVGISYFRPTKNVWLVIGFQKSIEYLIKWRNCSQRIKSMGNE